MLYNSLVTGVEYSQILIKFSSARTVMRGRRKYVTISIALMSLGVFSWILAFFSDGNACWIAGFVGIISGLILLFFASTRQ